MTSGDLRVWINGRLVPADQPALLPIDHGLTVGDGVFETLKVVAGRPFALTRHLRRLSRSATGLGLPVPDPDAARRGVEAVLTAGPPIPFGRLRITMTGGPGPLGSGRGEATPTLLVLAAPITRPESSTSVVLAPWSRNERGAVAGLKTTSYAENVVALAHARARGASEALLANTRGQLCEGTGSNVVLAVGGRLVTPPLTSGCLAGITRELLLEWAAQEGPAVEERDVDLDELGEADEVLLTSSTRDVQPVHRVDDRRLAGSGPLGQAASRMFARQAALTPDP
jgi:branched-chain amino acid aminotransferase